MVHAGQLFLERALIRDLTDSQHNPTIFPNPLEFNPDRFLEENESGLGRSDAFTEGHYAFGFGRRLGYILYQPGIG